MCGGGGGKNNIKEGSPHGSRAPSGRLRRQLKKTNHAVLAVRSSVSGACVWGVGGGGGAYWVLE